MCYMCTALVVMSAQLTCCHVLFEPHKFAMCDRCRSAKELETILLSENNNVYHSVGVLMGSTNSAFAGKIALIQNICVVP